MTTSEIFWQRKIFVNLVNCTGITKIFPITMLKLRISAGIVYYYYYSTHDNGIVNFLKP